MNKKIVGIFIGMLLFSTATIAVTAIKIDKTRKNSPPNPPDITVPVQVKRGKLFNVTVVTEDPDGDEVYYRHKSVNCTSSWFGPFPSGWNYTFKLSIFGTPGTYTIGVQAKDVNEAESEWAYAKINVPRNKETTTPILNLLKNNFKLFLLVKYFFGFN